MSIISREWVFDGDSRTRGGSVRLDSLIWLESAVQGSKISAVIKLGRSCVNEATAKEAVRPRTDASGHSSYSTWFLGMAAVSAAMSHIKYSILH
jgi:hypothetical protein